MSECKTIACVNQKGGVGKSVTSTNLGVGLARHGKKVLIVDCDSQASQTVSLGWREDDLPVTLATLFALQLERRPCDPREDINPGLKVDGVLITLANMRTVLARNSVETIRAAYGGNLRVYTEQIPYSVKVKEASGVGQSIFAYEPGGKAAAAYESLVKEVLRDVREKGAGVRDSRGDR